MCSVNWMLSVRCKKGTPIRSAISLRKTIKNHADHFSRTRATRTLTDKQDRSRKTAAQILRRLECLTPWMVGHVHRDVDHEERHR